MTPRELIFVSPSRLSWLLRCPFKVTLDLATRPAPFSEGDATRLGRCVHLALRRLVDTGAAGQGDLAAACEREYAAAVEEIIGPLASAELTPGYHLKRARLLNGARWLAQLLDGARSTATEVALQSVDGQIRGTADLIVAAADGPVVVDYKSGIQRDLRSGDARVNDYVRQIQLYAYLVHETNGVWPVRGWIVPLDGPPIPVAVDPEACSAAAASAREALAVFIDNPGGAPAHPSSSACRFCPHQARCDAFASSCDASWAPALLAVIGRVAAIESVLTGVVSLVIDVDGGSVSAERVGLTRVSPMVFPEVSGVAVGSRVLASGLVPNFGAERMFGLAEWGTFELIENAADWATTT